MGAALSSPSPVRRALLTALVALGVHVGLLALWPVLRFAYAPAWRALEQLGVALLDPLPGRIDVSFVPGEGGLLAHDLVAMDTVVQLQPRAGGAPATFGGSSFFHGWFPTSVLLALFAAVRWSSGTGLRRGLVLALVLLHVGLLLRVLPSITYTYAQCTFDGRPALDLGPWQARALLRIRHAAWVDVLPNYVGPLLLAGLCLRPRSGEGKRGGRGGETGRGEAG